jgi:hypothetical protein
MSRNPPTSYGYDKYHNVQNLPPRKWPQVKGNIVHLDLTTTERRCIIEWRYSFPHLKLATTQSWMVSFMLQLLYCPWKKRNTSLLLMKIETQSSICSLTIILTELYEINQCPKIIKRTWISRFKKVIKKVKNLSSCQANGHCLFVQAMWE